MKDPEVYCPDHRHTYVDFGTIKNIQMWGSLITGILSLLGLIGLAMRMENRNTVTEMNVKAALETTAEIKADVKQVKATVDEVRSKVERGEALRESMGRTVESIDRRMGSIERRPNG